MIGPRVVVIGAGSLFFGRQAIWQMAHSPYLREGVLVMVDVDTHRLSLLQRTAQRVIHHIKSPLQIETTTDYRRALDNADFVVLSFARDSVRWRTLECKVSAKYGIRMCSGDTIGPGGVFRALRELPTILSIARDIEKQCPNAWVINYINPAAVNGIALHRYAPKLKTFALCDGLHMPRVKKQYAVRAGIIDTDKDYTRQIDADFDMAVAGPNHFTWMLKATYKGCDVMPRIAASLREKAVDEDAALDVGAKRYLNNKIAYQLYELFGCVPTCVAHTKEYVRFWQGRGVTNESIPPLRLWDFDVRIRLHEKMWHEMKSYADGSTPIEQFVSRFGPDHATDIIESMWGDLNKPFYVNTVNHAAVTNMADDAYLELLCDLNTSGIRRRSVGPMPRGLRSAMQQILDTHELTAEAAVSCDPAILRRALITDPLTCSIGETDAIITELLEAEREVLPKKWFMRAAAQPTIITRINRIGNAART